MYALLYVGVVMICAFSYDKNSITSVFFFYLICSTMSINLIDKILQSKFGDTADQTLLTGMRPPTISLDQMTLE